MRALARLLRCTAITAPLFLALFICLSYQFQVVSSFAEPLQDFLLDIDGVSVTAGREHACLLEQLQGDIIGGRAQCWGYDDYGQTEPPLDTYFVQLATAHFFSCGITVEQNLYCWGWMLGSASNHEPGTYKQIPGLYLQVSADGGGRFGCGIMTDGSISCFGHLEFGVSVIPKENNFVQISCSRHHCCALDNNAYPHCFGRHYNKEVVPPTITYTSFMDGNHVPPGLLEQSQITGDEKAEPISTDEKEQEMKVQFRQVSVSDGLTCGITLIGSDLHCWGTLVDKNDRRRRSSETREAIPRYVKGPFRQVSAGGLGICAIAGDPSETHVVHKYIKGSRPHSSNSNSNLVSDSLHCWGTASSRVAQDHFEAWDQISVSSNSACGVSMDSQIECFGLVVPRAVRDTHRTFMAA